jgi:hypothetical protein
MYKTESVVDYDQLWSLEAGLAQIVCQSKAVQAAKRKCLPAHVATESLGPMRSCIEWLPVEMTGAGGVPLRRRTAPSSDQV